MTTLLPGPSKFDRQQNLGAWGYNTPHASLFRWTSAVESTQKMSDTVRYSLQTPTNSRVSIRTVSEHHKVHWPNITFNELGERISQLHGIDFIASKGIDPKRSIYAGCLWIDHNRRFLLELVDGPATVRDLTYGKKPISISVIGDFDAHNVRDRIEELDLDKRIGTGVANTILLASEFPISGVVIELSIYSYAVGTQEKPIIFWDYLRDDSEIEQRVFHWRTSGLKKR